MLSISGAFTALPYVCIVIVTLGAWNWAIENPSIRREARQGYVVEATLTAANAKVAEMERQAQAARGLADTFRREAEAATVRAMADKVEADRRIDEYERQRAAAGRACPLSADDLERLR